MKAESLIGVSPLTEIAETAIFSAHLTDTIPISVIYIGPSGAGKSKLLLQYNRTNGCHTTSDITSMGLQDLLTRDHENKISFLIIPDFNLVLSHRASTLQLTIANLLSVTSEGTIRIDDGRDVKETKHSPVGILTAMTRELYAHVARKWAVLGFARRFLPIYYDYRLETKLEIQGSIANGRITLMQLASTVIKLPRKQIPIAIGSLSQKIQILSDELANNIGYMPTRSRKGASGPWAAKATFVGKQLEFSPHLALRSMARAHALRDNRKEVRSEDVDFLMRLISFTRYDQPGLL